MSLDLANLVTRFLTKVDEEEDDDDSVLLLELLLLVLLLDELEVFDELLELLEFELLLLLDEVTFLETNEYTTSYSPVLVFCTVVTILLIASPLSQL